jgi:yeast amino acid transporter
MKALKAHGMSRDDLPYKAPFQPFGSWFALISTTIILIFKGFDTFMPFTKDTFVTSYIGIPVFALLYAGYKLYYKTKLIPSNQVDLHTGLDVINEEEERFIKEQESLGEKTWRQKLWDSL